MDELSRAANDTAVYLCKRAPQELRPSIKQRRAEISKVILGLMLEGDALPRFDDEPDTDRCPTLDEDDIDVTWDIPRWW